MRRAVVIAGLTALCALRAAAACAQQRLPLELDWQAPAECPNGDAVRAELERIARVQPGYSLTPLAARARVERRAAQYATALHTEHAGEAGERTLEAGDCATLVRTVTLVLALAFGDGVEVSDASAAQNTTEPPDASPAAQKNAGAQQARPAPAATSTTASTAVNTTAPDDRGDDTAAARDRRMHWSFLAGAGAQLGLLPATAFAASAGAEVAFGALAIGLRASAWPGVTQHVAAQLDAHFEGASALLQGCARLPAATFMLALCAETRAAALRGRSNGAAHDDSATAPWYALAAATAITWPRDAVVGLRLQAALAASLNRPRFVIENLTQAYRVPALAPDFTALLVITPRY